MTKARTLRIEVARPCPVSWDSMAGDERARFCAICQKHVYNLSAMKVGEAQDLLRAKDGKVCVRFYERADGTVMTEDCGFGVARAAARARRFVVRTFGAAIGLLGLAGGVWSVFGDDVRRAFGQSVDTMDLPAPPPPKPEKPHRNVVGFASSSVIE